MSGAAHTSNPLSNATSNASTRLGPYELVREVGYGGMGSVFLGRRVGLGGFHKWVAIKTIHPHLAKESAFVTMFLDEARTAASMQHPNVTTVFDVGEAEGTYYLAMEYLHGEHLGELQETGPVAPHLAAYMIARAAEGLHHAHEITDEQGLPRGLVHRDVSPHNIFLTYDGHVKVTDFGIARAEGRLAQTTETGRIKGKCAYMAPEQVQAQPLDRRADLFALGVVLWELSTDARLYVAESDAHVLLAILREEPRRPSALVPDYPPELEAIVMRCLARERDDRFATGAELARALDAFVATSPTPIGASSLAALMTERFGDRRQEKDRLLRSGTSPAGGSASPTAQTVEVDASEPSLSAPGATPSAKSTPDARRGTPTPALPQKRPNGLMWGLAAFLLLGGLAAGVWLGGSSKARVHVATDPSGAEVTLDGRAVDGSTPLVVEDVARGNHTLTITLEGHEPRELRFDAEGDEVWLRYPLTPTPTVASNEESEAVPSEAVPSETVPSEAVPTEAVPSDTTPTEPTPTETTQTPSRSTRRRPRAATEEQPVGRAKLNLITIPWATARINGRDYGNTPFSERDVPAGRLEIQLRARGEGEVVTRTLQAAPGQSVSLRVTLPD
ncbi:MAG: protein kinase [Sandaracinus sp.]|nr:protein kinase [Sandaracinus sp.]